MKLERAQEHLTTAIAIAVGMFLAYYFGKLSGAGRFGTIFVSFLLFTFLGLLLALREQIWILIPATWEFGGRVIEIKGNPAVRDIAVLLVFAGVFALSAFKILRRKPSYRAIDFWVFVVLAYLFTVFLRNPTGGDAIGSERVGGRPYLNIFTAWLGFLVLARVSLPVRLAKRMFWTMASLLCLNNLLTVIAINIPATQPYLERVIGGVEDESTTSSIPEEYAGRKAYLIGVGAAIIRSLTAYFPPLSLLNPVNFVRFGFLALGGILALFSGFRSGIIQLTGIFLLASYMRSGIGSVFRLAAAALVALIVLIVVQGTVIDLPFPVQRALSFLPGNWDRAAVADAQESSDWRYFMWKQMLFTDRYITSKWLGDGFGLTSMQLQQSQQGAAQDNPDQLRESFMIVGEVHSGPVSTIRYVGYIGLAIFLCLLFTVALEAWRICRASEGTPFQPLALFVGLPLIYFPFHFIAIFGSYDNDVPTILLGAGMLKMLRTSLDEYRSQLDAAPPRTESIAPLPEARSAVPAHLRY